MSHHCEAALVVCEDFRLHQRRDGRNCIADFVRRERVDCDYICRAGGIQDLVRPKPGYDEALLRDLTVSVNLHQVRRILLISHQDCGAYKPLGFASLEAETNQHKADLALARTILWDRFPGIEIQLFLATLSSGSRDDYVIEPLV